MFYWVSSVDGYDILLSMVVVCSCQCCEQLVALKTTYGLQSTYKTSYVMQLFMVLNHRSL